MKGVTVLVLTAVLLSTAALHLGLALRGSGSWEDGDTEGRWTVLYTGYGEASGDDDEVVLEPRSASSAESTHAGLVHTTETFRDASLEVTVHTEEQLRQGVPNVWEVGWVLWNFCDNDHFYAVALKPNGWEISKQDPAYPGNQRFLATGSDRTFPIGQDYRVRVEQHWPRMTVSVDGKHLATVVDAENPYREGSVALYTEDARVRFSDLDVRGRPGG